MGYTATQAIAEFRGRSGENNTLNPSADTVLGFINRAYTSERLLARLYPARSADLGTLVQENSQNLAANTHKYALTNADTIIKLGFLQLKFSGSADVLTVHNNEILQRVIEEDDELAGAASTGKPAVGFLGGYLYIWPETAEAVTDGLKVNALYRPDKITSSQSLAVSNAASDLIVLEAIRLYCVSRGMKEKAGDFADEVAGALGAMLAGAPGSGGEKRLQPSMTGGNLAGLGRLRR